MNKETELEVKYCNPELEGENFEGKDVVLRYGFGPIPEEHKNKKIFFFDIDNCLYCRSTRIHDMMQEKIHEYFKTNLLLTDEDAHNLHMKYYKTYGLALEGLVRNHQVDALAYNAQVDDALDLKSVLKPDVNMRNELIRIKKEQGFDFFWLITNAYKNHALRVISFLGLGDLFDGLTFCDYSTSPITCKPMDVFFMNCLSVARIDASDPQIMKKQYYVDDSEINVKAASRLGFGHVIHYVESEQDYEALKSTPDFTQYYSIDYNDDCKIRIIRNMLDLHSVLE